MWIISQIFYKLLNVNIRGKCQVEANNGKALEMENWIKVQTVGLGMEGEQRISKSNMKEIIRGKKVRKSEKARKRLPCFFENSIRTGIKIC